MIYAYEDVQNIPPDPANPDVENIVAEILVYSDATWLAQFGTASAHPIYFFFGNLSKYICCQPGSHAAHHGAHLPEVSSDQPSDYLSPTQTIWYSSLILSLIGIERSLAETPLMKKSHTAGGN